jgi:hypothetical protein
VPSFLQNHYQELHRKVLNFSGKDRRLIWVGWWFSTGNQEASMSSLQAAPMTHAHSAQYINHAHKDPCVPAEVYALPHDGSMSSL